MPFVSVTGASAVEGNYANFTVSLDAPAVTSVTVKYRFLTGGGFGTITTDELYNVDQGEVFTLTFAAGETSKTVQFYVPNDSADEVDEFFTLELFDPTNAQLAGNAKVLRAIGVGQDNDGAGTNLAVFVGSPLVVEGNSGSTVARFEIRLSAPAASNLTLNYATIDGSAVAGSDYTAKSGSVTILAGQTSAFVDVNVTGDTAREGLETFFLRVTPPASAPNPAGVVGAATILNDDKSSAQPSISVEPSVSSEGEYLGFVVRLDAPSTASVTVSYRILTSGGLGTISTDELYSIDQGEVFTVTFAPGETSKTIRPYVPSDSRDELDEFYTLELFDPINAELAGGAPVLRAMGVALDDDGAGSNLAVFVGSPVVLEGNSGSSVARFEIRLSAPSASDITLNYTTLDGSATAGSDYTAKSGTVTLLAGQTSAYVDVNVTGDSAREGLETFFLRVTPPAAAPNPAGVVGTATILNDDKTSTQPSISVESSTAVEGENLGFVIRLDTPSTASVTVKYRILTSGGLGTISTDELYSVDQGEIYSITFAPGETSKTIRPYVPSDSADELDEFYTLELFEPVNAELAGGVPILRTLGVALDDDGAGSNLAVFVGSPILLEGNSGSTVARFEVRLSTPAASDITLNYTTLDGSATAGSDYTAKSGTITLLAGQISAYVDVNVTGDSAREDLETFFLRVTPPAAAPNPAGVVGTATILNDDKASTLPSVSIESSTAVEGDNLGFVVRLDAPSTATVTVKYRLLTGTGLGTIGAEELYSVDLGEIYTLTFAPGETTKTLAPYVPSDSRDELDEFYTLEVFDPVNAELAGGAPILRTMGVALDDDGAGSNLAVFVGSPILLEGNSGSTVARFEVRLSTPAAGDITLNYTTLDGSATAGSDYTAKSGTLTLLAGQISAFVDVNVTGDSAREGLETFFLRVTPPAAAPNPAGVVGTATILNDDKAGTLPSLSVEPSTAIEGESLGFVVRLDTPSTASVTVTYRILTGGGFGTISPTELYSVEQGRIYTLTFAPGETTKTLTPYIPSDSRDEIDAFYTLELFDPVNAELAGGVPVLRTMGIALDDDGAGSNLAVFVGSPILIEGNSGTSVARFEVRLSAPAASDITLNYATSDGSATAGSDYTAKSGTVTILAGQTSAYVDVNVAGDTAREGAESFFLRVTPPAAAPNAAGVVGMATILNDDTLQSLPSISIESSSAVEGDNAGFVLRLDKPSATTVTASLRLLTGNGYGTFSSTELGSAANVGQTITVTFAPGQTTKTLQLYINGDSTDEIDENFTLELFSVTNAEMAGGVSLLRASGVALDDDGAGDNIALAGHATGRMELVDGTVDIQFEVRLSRPAANAVTVNYTTANGSAIAGQDFTAVSGSLTFQPGETVKIVTVKALPDQVLEGNEDFFLTVTPVTVGVGPAGLNIAGTIIDLQGDVVGTPGDDTLIGSPRGESLSGLAGVDSLRGNAGNDTIDGGSNVDTAIVSGNRSAYTINQTSTGVFSVSGPDGTDTLLNVEYLQFADQKIRLYPGTGTTVDFNADPATFMSPIRDFDGNDVGAASDWKRIGAADVNGDGDIDQIFANRTNGRFAEVATAPDGKVYFSDHGWAGETRVVGIYIDPLVQLGLVEAGGPNDSQRRFQNDLFIGNIKAVLGAGDYDRDGLQEVYFSLTDGTAFLHAYMHADGNIRYANYQSQQQVIDFLTQNGWASSTYDGWFT